ncbi:uncharacterized protein LOC120104164 [Phoenix dactylifera]|uniref:Uncharacterized protein LOC120104164 n=1 Tax=Phoenix dactylifera TaxID=42345 RepID=A0A8B8ZBJ1_PHODC|nr:uncharacterized protein LOC120104164 [Phoenix dactylifera]
MDRHGINLFESLTEDCNLHHMSEYRPFSMQFQYSPPTLQKLLWRHAVSPPKNQLIVPIYARYPKAARMEIIKLDILPPSQVHQILLQLMKRMELSHFQESPICMRYDKVSSAGPLSNDDSKEFLDATSICLHSCSPLLPKQDLGDEILR